MRKKLGGSVLAVQMSFLLRSFKVYISNIPANDMSYVTKMPYNFPKKTILLEALEWKWNHLQMDNISDKKIARISKNW